MKSALILTLAGSAVAAPSFGSFFDALFGDDSNNDNNNAPRPSDFANFPPFGTGSGLPFPFPTGTGASFPYPSSDSQGEGRDKALNMDYKLAPTAAPALKKRELKYRQQDASPLPSFDLLDPNATPTEPASGLPTGFPTNFPGLPSGTGIPSFPTGAPTDFPSLPSGLPTDFPSNLPTNFPTPPSGGQSAPFPYPTGGPSFPSNGAFPSGEPPFPTNAPFPSAPAGTGFPGFPSTLETLTRGPRPTSAPDAPGEETSDEPQNGNSWLDWISNLLSGDKGGE